MPKHSNQFNSSPRLISLLERLLSTHLRDALKLEELNITVEEWRVLFYLWNQDELTQNEIAAQASKEKSTITRKIDALESKGYVKRQYSSQDGRNKKIVLTTKGKHIEERSIQLARNITTTLEKGISLEEIASFKRVLNLMTNNLRTH